MKNPLKYYDNNTARSLRLIESAVAAGVRHFIFSSTAACYGSTTAALVDESHPTAPINPYGRSKLMIEQMLGDVASAERLNVGILRYFNVAGADARGRAGQQTAGATHLVKVAVEAALGKRHAVEIMGTDFATPDGTGVRDYIHVSDLVDAHLHVIDLLISSPTRNFLFNCGYGRGHSVLEVLDAVERASGTRIRRIFEQRRPGDCDSIVADNSRILAATAWRPRFDDLDLMVQDALRWERLCSDPAPVSAVG